MTSRQMVQLNAVDTVTCLALSQGARTVYQDSPHWRTRCASLRPSLPLASDPAWGSTLVAAAATVQATLYDGLSDPRPPVAFEQADVPPSLRLRPKCAHLRARRVAGSE